MDPNNDNDEEMAKESDLPYKTLEAKRNCDECGKSFKSRQAFSYHTKNAHIRKKFPCNSCNKSFKKVIILRKHVKIAHGNSSLNTKQGESNDTLNSCEDLNNSTLEPLDISTNDENGPKTVPSENLIKSVHEETKPSQETNNCDQCNKSFKSKQKLQVHDDSVHKGIKFSCKSCGKSLTQKAALNRHMKTAHGISEKNKHDNENGPKTVPSENLIKSVHEETKPSQETNNCDKCNKSFKSRQSLNIHHDAVHKGIKYSCKSCGKSLTQKSALNRHMKTEHNDENEKSLKKIVPTEETAVNEGKKEVTKSKNSCDSCGKSFQAKGLLQTHIDSVHRGLKPFSCKLCDKKYTQSHSLKSHILSFHEGKKPFKCASCNQAFSQKSSLKTHMKSHDHDNQCYKCKFCDKNFSQANSLQSHIETAHEGTKMESFHEKINPNISVDLSKNQIKTEMKEESKIE